MLYAKGYARGILLGIERLFTALGYPMGSGVMYETRFNIEECYKSIQILGEAMNKLSPQEQRVIRSRYDLDKSLGWFSPSGSDKGKGRGILPFRSPVFAEELGELGINPRTSKPYSKSWVYKKHNDALAKLRHLTRIKATIEINFKGAYAHALQLLGTSDAGWRSYLGKITEAIDAESLEITYVQFRAKAGFPCSADVAELYPEIKIWSEEGRVIILPTGYNREALWKWVFPEDYLTQLEEMVPLVVDCHSPLTFQDTGSMQDELIAKFGEDEYSVAYDEPYVEFADSDVELKPLPERLDLSPPIFLSQNRGRSYRERGLSAEFWIPHKSDSCLLVRVIEEKQDKGYEFAEKLGALELSDFEVEHIIIGSSQGERIYSSYTWYDGRMCEIVTRNHPFSLSDKLIQRYQK